MGSNNNNFHLYNAFQGSQCHFTNKTANDKPNKAGRDLNSKLMRKSQGEKVSFNVQFETVQSWGERSRGRGAATLKAPSPRVPSLVRGMARRPVSDGRRFPGGVRWCR